MKRFIGAFFLMISLCAGAHDEHDYTVHVFKNTGNSYRGHFYKDDMIHPRLSLRCDTEFGILISWGDEDSWIARCSETLEDARRFKKLILDAKNGSNSVILGDYSKICVNGYALFDGSILVDCFDSMTGALRNYR